MIYSLDSIADKRLVGNKAYYLMELRRSNYNVPNGFVIDINDIKKLLNKDNKIINEIYIKTKSISAPYIVRSSGIEEDSFKKSLAGKFKSILNVNKNNLIEKIIEVAKSGNNLAVIVQEQITPDLSGVFFTVNPTTGKDFIIEYVEGHLENMIRGKELSHKINSLEDLLPSMKNLYLQGKQLEEYLGFPVDIEFGIKNNKLFLFQLRPITVIQVKKKSKVKTKNMLKLKGIPLSLGEVKGKVQFIYDSLNPKEAERIFKKGNILATYVLFPEYNNVYKKAKAVICMVDSITSHPAIISRELGIPCVGGIDITYLSKVIKDYDLVYVNANEGEVYYNPRTKIKENIDFSITEINYPATKEYLNYEDKLKESILNQDIDTFNEIIQDITFTMRKKFEKFLKTKNKKYLHEAKSLFYNIAGFLQKGILIELKNLGYTHKELLKIFTKPTGFIGELYKTIKNTTSILDNVVTIDNKSIWDFSW